MRIALRWRMFVSSRVEHTEDPAFSENVMKSWFEWQSWLLILEQLDKLRLYVNERRIVVIQHSANVTEQMRLSVD